MNLSAARGVAVREFKLAPGHGCVDYMLFVDGKAVGVLQAKPEGYTLSGVEIQAHKYSRGLPAGLGPPVEPLPFLYLSTGTDTMFINLLDPDPRSRRTNSLPKDARTRGFAVPHSGRTCLGISTRSPLRAIFNLRNASAPCYRAVALVDPTPVIRRGIR